METVFTISKLEKMRNGNIVELKITPIAKIFLVQILLLYGNYINITDRINNNVSPVYQALSIPLIAFGLVILSIWTKKYFLKTVIFLTKLPFSSILSKNIVYKSDNCLKVGRNALQGGENILVKIDKSFIKFEDSGVGIIQIPIFLAKYALKG